MSIDATNRGEESDSRPNTEPDLLKISEVARRLSISRSLAYGLVASGAIPSIKVTDRAIRVSRAALAAWIAQKQRG